ncbi:Uncharacterised protein [Chlamydia abortus]|nr:cytochrome c oxidase subunit 3 [Chlamydia psittaci 02DC18]EPJ26166.1 cytochrome c oxidase subunit 3 [Chlamydia psittaci 03DC29]SGA00110.1 Uncharacterised protein [Chlamydia abortus]SGA03346.1 Uncharacterised protein [Chlamydia abortus]SGA03438.1 Uncharacterised protein [Chlamydia abortus]
MISLLFHHPIDTRPTNHNTNPSPMMTRYRTRKHLSRTSHDTRSKKPSIWHSPIHYLRNLLLYRVLLSILPLKPSPNPSFRRPLTTNRYYPIKSLRSTPSKYLCTISIRSNNYLSSPQPYKQQSKTNNPSPTHHNSTRHLFHPTTNFRVLRSTLHHFRRYLWLNILYRYGFPWTPRHHWIHFPPYLSHPPTIIPLHTKPPLRL